MSDNGQHLAEQLRTRAGDLTAGSLFPMVSDTKLLMNALACIVESLDAIAARMPTPEGLSVDTPVREYLNRLTGYLVRRCEEVDGDPTDIPDPPEVQGHRCGHRCPEHGDPSRAEARLAGHNPRLPCTCGHTLGVHSARHPQPCFGPQGRGDCSCTTFVVLDRP